MQSRVNIHRSCGETYLPAVQGLRGEDQHVAGERVVCHWQGVHCHGSCALVRLWGGGGLLDCRPSLPARAWCLVGSAKLAHDPNLPPTTLHQWKVSGAYDGMQCQVVVSTCMLSMCSPTDAAAPLGQMLRDQARWWPSWHLGWQRRLAQHHAGQPLQLQSLAIPSCRHGTWTRVPLAHGVSPSLLPPAGGS